MIRRLLAIAAGSVFGGCEPLKTPTLQTVMGSGPVRSVETPIWGTEVDLTGARHMAAFGRSVMVTRRDDAAWVWSETNEHAHVLSGFGVLLDIEFRAHGELRGLVAEPCALVAPRVLLAGGRPCPPGFWVERLVAAEDDGVAYLQSHPIPVAFIQPTDSEPERRAVPEPCGRGEPVGDISMVFGTFVVSCPGLGSIRSIGDDAREVVVDGLDTPGPLGRRPQGGIAWIEGAHVLGWLSGDGVVNRIELGRATEATGVAWTLTGPYVLDAAGPRVLRVQVP